MEKTADIVIVGGGIIGTSIAFHLARKGAKGVVLLEKGMLGEGSTSKCVGGIRAQFSTEINIRFSLESLKTWEHFEELTGVDLENSRVGYLFLATTEKEWTIFQANAHLQRTFGIPVELLLPQEIKYRWPYLKVDDLQGGTFCPWDGFAGPYEALSGFIKIARKSGVKIYEGTEVQQILQDRGKITGVRTTKGDIAAPIVINAAGPFAEEVGKMAGVEVPVKPYRRQIFFTAPFPWIPDPFPLMIDFHRGWYFRREGQGLLLSGPKDDFPSFNVNVDYDTMAEVAENSIYRVPILEKAEINRGWAGSYEISPDNHAILGEAPGVKGLFLANGFSGHGFQHSPAVGQVMADLILGEKPSMDISGLSVERFPQGQLIQEPMTAFKE
ncbi:MAG: FAD-binding oxidoreductase [Deltaproteobacteria bacterium]|nr:FAD-binding oxidoreductase [Deltaproteobacteria bacterium]